MFYKILNGCCLIWMNLCSESYVKKVEWRILSRIVNIYHDICWIRFLHIYLSEAPRTYKPANRENDLPFSSIKTKNIFTLVSV